MSGTHSKVTVYHSSFPVQDLNITLDVLTNVLFLLTENWSYRLIFFVQYI